MHRLHDAEIVGLALSSSVGALTKEFVLTVRAVEGHCRTLRFRGVVDWVFSPFGTQNVILDFYAYDHLTLTEHILEFFDVPAYWAEDVRNGTNRLYALTASVGMEGIVLAQGLTIDEEK
jgi:hypothetical protein